MKNPLLFAKIIPTPTMHEWAQAYNAGNLIAVIALKQLPMAEAQDISDISLPLLGKDLINTLEAEFFTLESKNLTTIKQALASTVEKVPPHISLSFGVSVIIENVVYLYLFGKGKILMKRKEKIGVLLEQTEEKHLSAGSGYIEDGDVILLESQQFSEMIPPDMVSPYLDKEKLAEMAEALSPLIHGRQLGGAAAMAFSFTDENKSPFFNHPAPVLQEPEKPLTNTETVSTTTLPDEPEIQENERVRTRKRKLSSFHFSHTRKLIITIVLIVVAVFAASIFFSMKKQKQVIDQKLYQQTVIPAQKKYDEAQSLMDLNKNLALEDFQSAKNILAPAVGKFPPQSKEYIQTSDLWQKITSELTVLSQQAPQDAKQVDTSSSPLLSALLQHSTAKYATQDDKEIYLAGDDGITQINKSDSKEKILVKNTSDWKNTGGFETYLGNFYLLDKAGSILKYVPSGDSFTKSDYFSTKTPDLSNANGIAIDGSIWIINADGSLAKYTRGKADSITLKSLDKPLNNPTRIYTSVDINTVYILDNGNKRIVVLDKNGNFLSQYPAGIVGQAVNFDVHESQKKIFIASSGKIWEIDLK